MRLLIVSAEPGWVDSLRSLFPADDVIAASVATLLQNPALSAAADACVVAESQTTPWTVETLKQLSAATNAPLFVLADTNRSQWEEAALFAGAEQVFRRPLKAAVLQLAISRAQRRKPLDAPVRTQTRTAREESAPGRVDTSLLLWRDFSRVLRHADEPVALLKAYLAALRDVLQCTRVVLYLPHATTAGVYRCAAAVGVDPATYENFRLSTRGGVAQLLAEHGTAIWAPRLRGDNNRDATAARELAVFGAELALPISGGSGLSGVLIIGPRVSGAPFVEDELALVHQAAEPLGGLLYKSSGDRHAPVASGEALLNAMPIPAALVTESLGFAAANPAFRALIGRGESATISTEDLPAPWAAAISAALENRAGSARVELEHIAIGTPRKVRLSLRRIEFPMAAASFLVTVEDIVPSLGVHESDPHSIANLLQRAGEQLSNEFRNALTPVDIMVQLSHETSTTRVELEQLSTQVSTAIHRLRRRIDDLAYLTKSAIIPERTTVSAVLRATRERLDEWVGAKHLKRVVWLNEFSTTELMADSRALAVAIGELVMNALEACDGKQVTVTAEDAADTVSFRVRNSGVWSPPAESSGFRHRPFVSSKSTGVGLGIEVATRVAENHGGRLIVGPVSTEAVEAILRIPHGVRPVATPRVEGGAVRVHG
jgi:nitrogen-specific signal transduction histidine kinase/DNA-binding NarL/FixJ family response regulator